MKALTPLLLILLSPCAIAGAIRDGAFLGEFVAARESIAPGETIDLALRIRHDEGFHTYWKAPGIVGVPTEIKWQSKGGLTPGEILWPQPQRIKMGPYDAYGYEGEVFLIVPVSAPESAQRGSTARLTARVSFMICPAVLSKEESCYPGFVDIHYELPISEKGGAATSWEKPITAARATFAEENTAWEPGVEREGDQLVLTLAPKNAKDPAFPKRPYFYSCDGQIHSDVEQRVERLENGSLQLRMTVSEFAPENPTHLRGILYTLNGLPDGTGAKPVRIEVPYGDG